MQLQSVSKNRNIEDCKVFHDWINIKYLASTPTEEINDQSKSNVW